MDKNQSLKTLVLSNCGIDKTGAQFLSLFMTKNQTLQKLNISKNGSMSNQENYMLIERALENNMTLEELDFNYITGI